ncbi:hypothetical protein [Metabacillus dongyingensis]|uniref:hypothetical protein n=1 Tax=Metabacillus dongyingensis TaxID=2874282 RepID=UPI001CBCE15E|nr:hypothetical protein [Metabacillus dongyingensis]UAL53950.1 hypothetical protein K8L98_09335 [Metabacillus dongyingensis]
MNVKTSKLEVLLWSIAFPGFGQLLNRQVIKGILFILLELLINTNSHFNQVIMLSFLGEIDVAIQTVEFGWLMFYPCVYMFAMYDAYKNADGPAPPLSFLPFAFGAYFVTVGLMYSPKLKLFGVLFGPIWLPMLSLIPGLLTGFLIRFIILRVRTIQKG